MQDYAYELRQQYINDYAARVKLPQTEQRALWIAHLRATKHPSMAQQQRREPIQGLAEALSKLEQDRTTREVWKEL